MKEGAWEGGSCPGQHPHHSWTGCVSRAPGPHQRQTGYICSCFLEMPHRQLAHTAAVTQAYSLGDHSCCMRHQCSAVCLEPQAEAHVSHQTIHHTTACTLSPHGGVQPPSSQPHKQAHLWSQLSRPLQPTDSATLWAPATENSMTGFDHATVRNTVLPPCL